MTFLDRLLSHKGGLIRLKTELYWYGGRGYDRSPDRICLILDAHLTGFGSLAADHVDAATPAARRTTDALVVALLLIDGLPYWVWVAETDVELL